MKRREVRSGPEGSRHISRIRGHGHLLLCENFDNAIIYASSWRQREFCGGSAKCEPDRKRTTTDANDALWTDDDGLGLGRPNGRGRKTRQIGQARVLPNDDEAHTWLSLDPRASRRRPPRPKNGPLPNRSHGGRLRHWPERHVPRSANRKASNSPGEPPLSTDHALSPTTTTTSTNQSRDDRPANAADNQNSVVRRSGQIQLLPEQPNRPSTLDNGLKTAKTQASIRNTNPRATSKKKNHERDVETQLTGGPEHGQTSLHLSCH